MTRAEKKKAAAAAAAVLALLLIYRLAMAKPKPKAVITVGPITVEDKERDRYDDARERRALLRNKALDIIAFDEDGWQPTRKPSLSDQIVLRSIFDELAQIAKAVPDPEGYDAGFDADLRELVSQADALDPATTAAVPPKAFGTSRWMTRRLDIEEQIRDLVAMGKDRSVRRRPTDGELAVIHALIAEHDALKGKLLALDPEILADVEEEPLEELVATALGLSPATSRLAAVSEFVPATYLG